MIAKHAWANGCCSAEQTQDKMFGDLFCRVHIWLLHSIVLPTRLACASGSVAKVLVVTMSAGEPVVPL